MHELSARAWTLITKESNYGGNEGYEDVLGAVYRWDSKVPNARRLAVGDRVIFRDGEYVLGVSVIERITEEESQKKMNFCRPGDAGHSKVKAPNSKRANWYCETCHSEFVEPDIRHIDVTVYSADVSAAWTSLDPRITNRDLVEYGVHAKGQHAMREANWDAFSHLVHASFGSSVPLTFVDARTSSDAGGHKESLVRVRKGQREFRTRLLRQFGEFCAFSGPCPEEAMDAAHLYSYAELGQHFQSGGFMLRRDLHTLFDRGMLRVHPELLSIEVHPDLHEFKTYRELHGTPLQVGHLIDEKHKRWLAAHYDQSDAIFSGA